MRTRTAMASCRPGKFRWAPHRCFWARPFPPQERRSARRSPCGDTSVGRRSSSIAPEIACAMKPRTSVARSRCRAIYDPSAPLADQAAAVGRLSYGTGAGFVEDARFLKLREIVLAVDAPATWARRVGAAGLTLTLAGRNLA